MSIANLPLIPGELPPGFCPASYQDLYNTMFRLGMVQFENSGFTVILSQDTQPTAAQRGFLWNNTNEDRIYRFHDGAWLARHEYPPGSPVRLEWTGTLVDLQTFDGGDTGGIADASGPMWEADTDYNDYGPIGVGSIVPTVGGTAGAVSVALTLSDLPKHSHFIASNNGNTTGSPNVNAGSPMARASSNSGDPGDDYALLSNAGETPDDATVGPTSYVGEDTPTPVSTLGPVRGTYFIKRSQRIYRKAS